MAAASSGGGTSGPSPTVRSESIPNISYREASISASETRELLRGGTVSLREWGAMRTTMSAPWVQIASFAVLVLFLAPLPLLAPPEPERYVLAEIGGQGLASVRATGIPVVEQDEGTFALLRGAPAPAARLRWLGVPLTEMPDRTVLEFSEAGLRFDTSQGEPALAAGLRSIAPRAFVVQFIGPIKAEWMTQIERLGADPQLYTPNHAYIVRMGGSAADAVRALPFVSYVGAYHPAYKISKV